MMKITKSSDFSSRLSVFFSISQFRSLRKHSTTALMEDKIMDRV